VVLREIARRTAGANPIIGIDINRYLLREAMSLATREGVADRITFQEGHAEAIPLAANSVNVSLSRTVMEEGDADQMLAELVRVTRNRAGGSASLCAPWTCPGGRISL
jgi:ubiquinone/menaquinone biosynthesis C-methylase UbiE